MSEEKTIELYQDISELELADDAVLIVLHYNTLTDAPASKSYCRSRNFGARSVMLPDGDRLQVNIAAYQYNSEQLKLNKAKRVLAELDADVAKALLKGIA